VARYDGPLEEDEGNGGGDEVHPRRMATSIRAGQSLPRLDFGRAANLKLVESGSVGIDEEHETENAG
jgi:hypothetical protein